MAETMKAWQLAAPGNLAENLQLNGSAPRPTSHDLRVQDILVRVRSAALNPADYKVVELGLVARAAFSFPKTPCMDLCGRVVAVGPAVTDVLVGDHVLGRLDPFKPAGALSEFVILERDGYAKIDRAAELDGAAGLGTAALTAYQTIKPHVKPGDRVFINGGSGGTGTFGIQVAKLLGCRVTTTCSTGKVALCKALGADEVVDYKTTDVLEALRSAGPVYSVFVDNVGAVGLHAHSAEFLLPEAPFVSIGGGSVGHVASVAVAMVRPAWLGGGRNRFISYEFGDVLDAFAHLKKGSSAGKVIVHVGTD